MVLSTSTSGSSPSVWRTTIARDSSGFAIPRSASELPRPVRHTTRARRGTLTLSRIADSISTRSRSASTTMDVRFRPAPPTSSSEMTAKICWLQPRITTWSRSRTRERPLRSSASLSWRPVFRMPMSVLMMKMPPNVTASMPTTNPTLPSSPPMVPGSSVRSIDIQRSVGRSRSSSPPMTTSTSTTPTMISSEIANSPAMSATVPRSMNRSKR